MTTEPTANTPETTQAAASAPESPVLDGIEVAELEQAGAATVDYTDNGEPSGDPGVDNKTFIAAIEERFSFDPASESEAPARAVARIGDDVDPEFTTPVEDCAAFFDAVHLKHRTTVRFGKNSFEVSPRRIVSQGRTLFAAESDCEQWAEEFSAVVHVLGTFGPYVNVASWEHYMSTDPCDGQDDENVTCSTFVSTIELRVVDSRTGKAVTFGQLFEGTSSEFNEGGFNVAEWDPKRGRARIVGGQQWQASYPYPGGEEWVLPHPKVAVAIASAHREGILRPKSLLDD